MQPHRGGEEEHLAGGLAEDRQEHSPQSERAHPVPPYMGRSYLNTAHTVNGALERLRWLIPGVVKDFGSDPDETIKQRFNRRGLPLHLVPYSLNTPRTESRPKGERMIDRRIQVTSSSASTQLQVTSTSTGSKPDL